MMLVRIRRGLRRAVDTLRNLFHRRGGNSPATQPARYLKYADWDGLKKISGVLMENTDTFGPLASAIARLSRYIEMFEDQVGTRKEYNKLGTDLNDLFCVLSGRLDGEAPLRIPQDRIINLAQAIDKENESLRQKEGTGTEQGAKTAVGTSLILECYRRIQTLLGRFVISESRELWKIIDEEVL
ncbi:hypothetical protein FRC08_001082, partial [Ceratobasidium sp. 394]